MAREYVNDNIDKLGEDIAGFVVGDNWLLKELGGEFVEDRIHDTIKWTYSPAAPAGDGLYQVVATANVSFTADYDLLGRSYTVAASLPFDLIVDVDNRIVSSSPAFARARLEHDIPDVPQLPNAEEVTEKVEEVKEDVEEKVDEVTDTAQEAVDAAKDALDTDCLTAAREAGVPDNILELIEKPKDERSGIENSILRRGLDAVGLSDACADVE